MKVSKYVPLLLPFGMVMIIGCDSFQYVVEVSNESPVEMTDVEIEFIDSPFRFRYGGLEPGIAAGRAQVKTIPKEVLLKWKVKGEDMSRRVDVPPVVVKGLRSKGLMRKHADSKVLVFEFQEGGEIVVFLEISNFHLRPGESHYIPEENKSIRKAKREGN